MIAFILTYPVYREAFAPDHIDCIVHHYISPLFISISEGLHRLNGNISHGNRVGHSAHLMAERIREDIKILSNNYTKPCIHMHRDISGFFMNINRQKAYELTEALSERFYNRSDRLQKLELLKITLLSDPLEGCIFKSPLIE